MEEKDTHAREEEQNVEKTPEKKPGKMKQFIGLAIGAVLLGGLFLIQSERVGGPIGGFDASYKEATWTEQVFRTYTPVESTLMDSSILDVNQPLKEWYDTNLPNEGVYAMNDGEHTYILATGGNAHEDTIIQLFDIVEGKGELVVGYSFLNPADLGIEPTSEIPNMILRIDGTKDQVVGRFIEEEEEAFPEDPAITEEESAEEEPGETEDAEEGVSNAGLDAESSLSGKEQGESEAGLDTNSSLSGKEQGEPKAGLDTNGSLSGDGETGTLNE